MAIPVTLYLIGLWFVRDRYVLTGAAQVVLPVFSVLILIAPLLLALEGIAVLTVLCVMMRNRLARTGAVVES